MGMIVAATGCGQMAEIKNIMEKHGLVVLGSMDKSKLSSLSDKINGDKEVLIYFYESGWDNQRKVIAVGNLRQLITVEYAINKKELAGLLCGQLGERWQALLVGPIEEQLFNDCFLVVQNLIFGQQGMLLALQQGKVTYNIIIG